MFESIMKSYWVWVKNLMKGTDITDFMGLAIKLVVLVAGTPIFLVCALIGWVIGLAFGTAKEKLAERKEKAAGVTEEGETTDQDTPPEPVVYRSVPKRPPKKAVNDGE